MALRSEVVVVGGGAVGCATAYLLAKEGVQVLLVERDAVGCAASGYAMGLLSPFSGAGIPGPLDGLSDEGFRLHQLLAAELREETGIDYEAHPHPALYVSLGSGVEPELEEMRRLAQRIAGLSARWVEGAELRAMEPRLSSQISKALHIEGPWLLESYKYTLALYTAAEKRGVTMVHGAVSGIEKRRGGYKVQLEDVVIETEKVVLSMGPWTGQAEKWLGVTVPISPLKGQILRLDMPGPPLKYAIHHNGDYIATKSDGLAWAGTTEERVGFDNATTEAARAKIMRSVIEVLPAVAQARLVLQTACLRPLSADGLPIIGEVPGWKGVYLASGAGRKGILLSPSMAKAVGDLIIRGSSPLLHEGLSLARFAATPRK